MIDQDAKVKLLIRIQNAEQVLMSIYDQWTQEVQNNFGFSAGHMYSSEQLEKLGQEKRPSFEYNILFPLLNTTLGNFISSLPGIQLIPKTPDDEPKVDLFTSVNDWILHQANKIEKELAMAFKDTLIGRIGWVQQSWAVTEDFPEGFVEIKRIDPFWVKIDPTTKRADLKDCQFMSVSSWLTPEELVNIYAANDPELEKDILEKSKAVFGLSLDSTVTNPIIATKAERVPRYQGNYSGEKHGFDMSQDAQLGTSSDWIWYKNGRLKTVDWYERKNVKTMTLHDTITGEEIDITDQIQATDDTRPDSAEGWYDQDKLDELRAQYPNATLKEGNKQIIQQTCVVPQLKLVLFDAPQDLQNGNFKYVPLFSYDYHTSVLEMKSLVDFMKDAVLSFNLRRNSMLTYLMRSSHGGYIAEDGALGEHLEDWQQPEIGKLLLVKRGELTKVMPNNPPPMPASLDKFAEEDMELTRYISGIRENAMGAQETSGESGTLFQQRVQQTEIQGQWITNNAQNAYCQLVKNNISFIKMYMNDNRIIRILSDENEPNWIQVNKPNIDPFSQDNVDPQSDLSFGNYDVQISAVPYGKQAKEAEYGKLVNTVMLIGKLNPNLITNEVITELIKRSNVIGKAELQASITQKMQQMEQQQAQQQQLAAQQAQAGTMQSVAKSASEMAKAKATSMQAELEPINKVEEQLQPFAELGQSLNNTKQS